MRKDRWLQSLHQQQLASQQWWLQSCTITSSLGSSVFRASVCRANSVRTSSPAAAALIIHLCCRCMSGDQCIMTEWFYGTPRHQPGFSQTRDHLYGELVISDPPSRALSTVLSRYGNGFSRYFNGTVTEFHGTLNGKWL